MTATEITPADKKTNYERLDFYIDQIATHMNNAYDIFVEYCRIATEEEHLTLNEAWQYVYTKLEDHIGERTLYGWADKALPTGAKKVTKPKGQNKSKKIDMCQSPEEKNNVNLSTTYAIQDAELASEQSTQKENDKAILEQEAAVIGEIVGAKVRVITEKAGPGEVKGTWNIAPEDYELQFLEEYDKDLLIRIVRHLDESLDKSEGIVWESDAMIDRINNENSRLKEENTELKTRIANLEGYHNKIKKR